MLKSERSACFNYLSEAAVTARGHYFSRFELGWCSAVGTVDFLYYGHGKSLICYRVLVEIDFLFST